MTQNFPARLHVLFARNSTAAVVFRRGPSHHTALIGWDRESDSFSLGQWLYGRIYERRADLSPDGKHLIYFALNARWGSEAKGSWSAISKAPYLKAVSLFPKGDGYHGGGLFLSNTEYWLNDLNDGHGHKVLYEDGRLNRVMDLPSHERIAGKLDSLYHIRLQRDGWQMEHTVRHGKTGSVTVFQKRISNQWSLRKLAHATLDHPVGSSYEFDTHELINKRTAKIIAKRQWEWAEVDGARLVWAEGGRICAGRIGPEGIIPEDVLFDFTPMKFKNLVAPY